MQFPAVDHLLSIIYVHILGAVFGLSVFQYAPKCLISSYWRSEFFLCCQIAAILLVLAGINFKLFEGSYSHSVLCHILCRATISFVKVEWMLCCTSMHDNTTRCNVLQNVATTCNVRQSPLMHFRSCSDIGMV